MASSRTEPGAHGALTPRAAAWAFGAAVWLLAAAAATAQGRPTPVQSSTGGLSSLSVPGGTAALARLAGVGAATPRGLVLLQIIRAVHEAPVGASPALDRRFEPFRAYLADLAGFLRARDALPGGRISAALALSQASRRAVADLAAAVGGQIDQQGPACRLALRDDEDSRRRRQSLEAAGLDVASVERDFNGGASVALAIPGDEVPLPLDADTWARFVPSGSAASGNLLTALLSDRRASLLYYGLMSVDRETITYVGAHPAFLDALSEGNRPAILATLGRGIRVRGGRIDVPGGPALEPAWEGLLGQKVTEPEPFTLELLDKDGGRAALLYDAIDHLDPARQAFALGLHMPDRGARAEYLQALLYACATSLAGWDPAARPFKRMPYDPVHLLAATHVMPSGELPPPSGRRFWDAALSGSDLPDEPERLVRPGEPDSSVDAAWLVQKICADRPMRREQLLKAWLFGQRAFPGLAPADLPQALVAIKGVIRFPMLLLTLERIGVTDPATYAGAVRHAQRLSEIGDRETAATALGQFQGALAIVERIRFSRAVSADAALRLVQSLAGVPLVDRSEYLGGIAVWLDAQLLPALGPIPDRVVPTVNAPGSAEATVLAAMAGLSAGAALPEVEWEGLSYRVDVGAADFARMVRVRRKQGGYGLDAVLGLSREVARLAAASDPPADAPPHAAALAASVSALLEQSAPSAVSVAVNSRLRNLLGEVLDELQRVKTPRNADHLRRQYRPLQRAGDLLLARVLSSIAYTPHLGEAEGPELLAGDPADRHSFGFEERIADVRAINPWRMPQRTLGVSGGWHVTGSVLGLDVGLATLVLRRLPTDGLPPPPGGNDIDRGALAASVALSNPFAMSDAERDALSVAVRQGRQRLGDAAWDPATFPGLVSAARVNEWWQRALAWALLHEPERVPDYFSLADLARIGAAPAPAPQPEAWGAARLDTEGCICLRYPRPGDRELLAGRIGSPLVAEQFVDLPLRVAEALSDLHLPARLARPVMALAAQDVLEAHQPAYIDDWIPLMTAVHRLSDRRFVDYIGALTAGGPLVPDDRERSEDVRR